MPLGGHGRAVKVPGEGTLAFSPAGRYVYTNMDGEIASFPRYDSAIVRAAEARVAEFEKKQAALLAEYFVMGDSK